MPHANRYARYCEGCNIELKLARQWLAENYYSRDQLNRLLRTKQVVGKKFKGKMYLAWNANRINQVEG